MGDVLFVWTAEYQICLMRECAPRLLSGLYQLFDLCLIKHVLTVWPHTFKHFPFGQHLNNNNSLFVQIKGKTKAITLQQI